jgi:hypothetical protein
VVRRFRLAAFVTFDTDGGQAVGGLRREQQVIDTQAEVTRPGAGLVVPIGILPPGGMKRADGIGQAKIEQRAEGRA